MIAFPPLAPKSSNSVKGLTPLDNIRDTYKNARRISYPSITDGQGTRHRNEIESRDRSLLHNAADAATPVRSERFGTGAVE